MKSAAEPYVLFALYMYIYTRYIDDASFFFIVENDASLFFIVLQMKQLHILFPHAMECFRCIERGGVGV